MSTYKQIKGVTVQTRDTDPELNVGSWSSGDTMNTPRSQSGSSGTQTSGLVFAGDEYPASPRLSDKNEYYNGSSWTELAEVNTARRLISGAGASHTSAIAFAGYTTTDVNNTETWNGSAWTEVNEMQTARAAVGEAGILTGALGMGGIISGPGVSNLVESWDGTNWTEVSELNTARRQIAGLGTYTAAFAVNGGPPAATIVEQWNGSSWTETTENNTGRYAGGACGTVTAGLFFCGNDPVVANTEDWNGTVWTEVNDLSTARKEAAPSVAGTSTVALASGGHTDAAKSGATEDWSCPSVPHLNEGDIFLSAGSALKGFGKSAGIPAATWSSGGSLNQGRTTYQGSATSGTQTATMTAGGNTPALSPANTDLTELYNGTSWTEVNELNESIANMGGAGTQTAALNFGGLPPTGPGATNEEWDGTSWTEVNDLNTARGSVASFGLEPAAICAGGRTPTKANVESWDGTNWTEVSDINTSRYDAAGIGRAASGLLAGGDAAGDSTSGSNTVEEWNGTSWTEIAEINTSRWGLSGAGVDSTNAIVFSGGNFPPGYKVLTEFWNGSSWTEVGDMSVARALGSSSGSAATAVAMGGQGTSIDQATTEEWTSDSALSTVTVS